MKIGFIGAGAMAEAMLSGIIKNNNAASQDNFLSDHKQSRCQYLIDTYGVQASVGAAGFISKVDLLFLAVKPQVVKVAIEEICPQINPKTIVVSVVAGLTTEVLEQHFLQQPVIRVMPNTPVAVGAGMSAVSLGSKAAPADAERLP